MSKDPLFRSKFTLDEFNRLRGLTKERKGVPEYKFAAEVIKEFEETGVTEKTLCDYIAICKTSDYIWKFFERGRISILALRKISRSKLDEATKDFVAREYVDRKMNIRQLEATKKYLADGCSLAESLDKATGVIPSVGYNKPKVVEKDLGGLLGEIVKLGTDWRMKVTMAMEILPMTTMDKGKLHWTLFNKVYMLRHTVKEQLEFLDARMKQYFEELARHSEAEEFINPKNGRRYAQGKRPEDPEEEGLGEEVRSVGAVVPDGPRPVHGQERERGKGHC
jgi:hypothetical protein